MAPIAVTEDYYKVLGVTQTAELDSIVNAYRRRARELHPDRNKKLNATAAFQLLGQAYETLRDKSKRREYDLIYPSLTGKGYSAGAQGTNPANPTSASTASPPSSGATSDAAQLAVIEKSKQERFKRWRITKDAFDVSISKQQKDISKLEKEIQALESFAAAEAATEAYKNSWGAWLLSPLYKKVEESEDVKARKDRERQERRIEKDMKERRLEVKKTAVKTEENRYSKAEADFVAGNLRDDAKIRDIQTRRLARENAEPQEKERLGREVLAKLWKQQQEQREEQERQAQEILRKHHADQRAAEEARRQKQAAERKREQDDARKRQAERDAEIRARENQYAEFFDPTSTSTSTSTRTVACRHDAWWPKIQGHSACPRCREVWTYLLQCPGCDIKACPRCQAMIRPRRWRQYNRDPRSRARSPSPNYQYGTHDWD